MITKRLNTADLKKKKITIFQKIQRLSILKQKHKNQMILNEQIEKMNIFFL